MLNADFKKDEKSPLEELLFVNSNISKFMILHQVLYFYEAINTLHTLMEKKNKPDDLEELSLAYYFYKTGDDNLKKEFENISEEYRNSPLKHFRNNFIAHKEANSMGDPFVDFLNPVKKEHIDDARKTLGKIKNLVNSNFDCSANNYFEDFYGKSIDSIYDFLTTKI